MTEEFAADVVYPMLRHTQLGRNILMPETFLAAIHGLRHATDQVWILQLDLVGFLPPTFSAMLLQRLMSDTQSEKNVPVLALSAQFGTSLLISNGFVEAFEFDFLNPDFFAACGFGCAPALVSTNDVPFLTKDPDNEWLRRVKANLAHNRGDARLAFFRIRGQHLKSRMRLQFGERKELGIA